MSPRPAKSLSEIDRCKKIPVGDQGQRFEIRGRMRCEAVEKALGWCDKAPEQMLAAFRLWPSIVKESVRIVDRFEPKEKAA